MTSTAIDLIPSAVRHGLRRLRRLLHDLLFLKTPGGVKPTDRARVLAGPVADLLTGVAGIVSTAGPFEDGAALLHDRCTERAGRHLSRTTGCLRGT